ncbi:HrpB1 family type III secretion system apparatus protein [Caballeronia calidae]|uniref:HrpB1 family type III secretion system apparatus protein n=1 Tax=Caballeronia calidae TaxID=1777139 RepID=UPI0012FE6A72|nr:HrpB1 family type III secretion system apparatus protein [Caballeronia calidae]
MAELFMRILRAAKEQQVEEMREALARLGEIGPKSREFATLKTLALINVKREIDALHFLNEIDSDDILHLKVMCLHSLRDPLWEGAAMELKDSEHPVVRKTVRKLLCIPDDDRIAQ